MFQQSMAEIAIELALGNQHKESLQQQLNEQKTLNQVEWQETMVSGLINMTVICPDLPIRIMRED